MITQFLNIKQTRILVVFACIILLSTASNLMAQNPIEKGKGLCDPQVRVYNDKVFLYATHDATPNSKVFCMNDWWIWSSTDLVNWKYERTLKPEETYYGKPLTSCWATDAAYRNGKYYFYFSVGVTNVGVVESSSPTGPWKDALGKALLPDSLTATEERDPGILCDDDGNYYIIFGVWDFYIAKLNPDMISLAETPRMIVLDKKLGPYGLGKTDDKPFLHKYNGKYYLSWGCYYAMSDSVYGPYATKGSIIVKQRTAQEFQKELTFDRHGSFFELYNQWYFICNDQSYPGSNRHFRNSVISYVHYLNNGEIDSVYIDTLGVGRYDAKSSAIQAENYFKSVGVSKRECPTGGFEIRDVKDGSYLVYPNVMHLKPKSEMSFHLSCANLSGATIEVRANNAKGKLLGKCNIKDTGSWTNYQTFTCQLNNKSENTNVTLVFRGGEAELLRLDWLSFK